ncbi:hypothetical protein K227x_64850 [Rubripirellula lacrimiformis]|uniref:Uncharacterized protein n=1 Tax=Rubripirellula lacrimiformis TaxID=1930273 RepID=A0A517NLQ3_9BACT|nr:hypothetical protein [Rubripirellula lacrimiformis]QDT08055.1 hypothetical protein K227x_64850 [Rubripirellula lacrimiformis]
MFDSLCRTVLNPSSASTGRLVRVAAVTTLAVMILVGPAATRSQACPFCNAVSQTLRQEMAAMDAVVIATATQSDLTRNKDTGEISMKVDVVLKGDQHVTAGSEVKAIYYGEVSIGRRFMLSGVDPPDMQWSCLPINERSEEYVKQVAKMDEATPIDRLRFYYKFLQDDESMLARDSYDEFAVTPYPVVKALAPEMDHAQLVQWITDPDTSTDRKRLFLTMLGACGDEKDLPMLEGMLRSTQKSTRGGLDALVACYLTLGGESGLPLVNELFLNNKDAPYADTYAAIMAIRFHGTEGDVIPRSALVESLHHVLDRKDLADLVIPDLARWDDWTQIDRLAQLFTDADPDNNWVRVPVVNYLRACPLPKAQEALEKLEKIDPQSVKRANTFFSIPVPARDTTGDGTSVVQPSDHAFASTSLGLQSDRLSAPDLLAAHNRPRIGQPLAQRVSVSRVSVSSAPLSSSRLSVVAPVATMAPVAAVMNPWRFASVLLMAVATVVIAQFLLLSGGAPSHSQQDA